MNDERRWAQEEISALGVGSLRGKCGATPRPLAIQMFLGTGRGTFSAQAAMSMGTTPMTILVGALSIESSALDSLSTVLIRQRELAQQAASGTISAAQRKALNSEARSLVSEYNRIVESTAFNQRKLIDGSGMDLSLQAGFGALSLATGEQLERTVGSGAFDYTGGAGTPSGFGRAVVAEDFNGDGNLDLAVGDLFKVAIYRGNGDGTIDWTSNITVTGGMPRSMVTADLDNNGTQDLIYGYTNYMGISLGNGDGTFQAATSFAPGAGEFSVGTADFNGDGKLDVAACNTSGTYLFAGQGNGVLAPAQTLGSTSATKLSIGDYNGDGFSDLATIEGLYIAVRVGLGNGQFRARSLIAAFSGASNLTSADLNGDGFSDIAASVNTQSKVAVFSSLGDGRFSAGTYYTAGNGPEQIIAADLNLDGLLDLATVDSALNDSLSVFLAKPDGSFGNNIRQDNVAFDPRYLVAADFNNDGLPDLMVTDGNISTYLACPTSVTTISYLDLTTGQGALSSMQVIDTSLERVALERGAVGASQSRIQAALELLSSIRENSIAASSRITDVDVASETASVTANSILQQVGQSILAQANQIPSLALVLLRQQPT